MSEINREKLIEEMNLGCAVAKRTFIGLDDVIDVIYEAVTDTITDAPEVGGNRDLTCKWCKYAVWYKSGIFCKRNTIITPVETDGYCKWGEKV